MHIDRLDHLVLTVTDIETTSLFYENILGMQPVSFGEGRKALLFGNQKINLHLKGKEIDPKALNPTVGSADLCFITDGILAAIVAELKSKNVAIIEGIVSRTGAAGIISSVYFRDPDGNLIEISKYE